MSTFSTHSHLIYTKETHLKIPQRPRTCYNTVPILIPNLKFDFGFGFGCAMVAQWLKQSTPNPKFKGSNPCHWHWAPGL
jgi:hypothetical protein